MEQPYSKQCDYPNCNKTIYGFSAKDLKWRMVMHKLSHRKEEKEKRENETTRDETNEATGITATA